MKNTMEMNLEDLEKVVGGTETEDGTPMPWTEEEKAEADRLQSIAMAAQKQLSAGQLTVDEYRAVSEPYCTYMLEMFKKYGCGDFE